MLVTIANKEGFGLTPLSGDRRDYMPPLLKKKKQKQLLSSAGKPLEAMLIVHESRFSSAS